MPAITALPHAVEQAPEGSVRPTVDDLVRATPADRDRVVDLVRVACIMVVVLGHWLMAVVRWDAAGLQGDNLLALEPWSRWLTWILQVMPLFFVVGGVANSASWRSASHRSLGYPAWIHGRAERLLRPVGGLVVAWTTGLALATALGANADTLRTASRLIAMPVWFLAVYLGVVAATPVMLWLHDRWARATALGLVVLAALVDALSGLLGLHGLAWVNFAFVWLFAHQLGFFWRDRRLTTRRSAMVLAGFGLVGLVAVTAGLGYPVSMVGGAGDRSNMTPPNLAIVALTLWQTGLLLLARPALARLAGRRRVWRAVIVGNGVAMTVYLWHLTALCLASVLLLQPGWFPQPAAGSAAWWAWRPVWIVLLLALLGPLVIVWSRIESAPRPARASWSGRGHLVQAATGALVAAAGLAVQSLYGFPIVGRAMIVPLSAPGLILLGVALIRATLLRELRPARK